MRVTVRPMLATDLAETPRLHRDVLGAEFVARCGLGFLRCYHRAWLDSPYGIALVAEDGRGDVVGVLLGAVHPAAHYRRMLLRDGLALGSWLALRSATHPSVGWEVVSTRMVRYAAGSYRIVAASVRRGIAKPRVGVGVPPGASYQEGASEAGLEPAVGEVTHLMVRADLQSNGVGRDLLGAAVSTARAEGLDELVLVTLVGLGAKGFYEHLGWEPGGTVVSRSGEHFFRYILKLGV